MLHFLLEIIIMTRSTKTRLLLRDKYKVVHSDRLYRPVETIRERHAQDQPQRDCSHQTMDRTPSDKKNDGLRT